MFSALMDAYTLPDMKTPVDIKSEFPALYMELYQFFNKSALGVPGNLASSRPLYHTYHCKAVHKRLESDEVVPLVPLSELRRLATNRVSFVCSKCQKIEKQLERGAIDIDDVGIRETLAKRC
jgi:hypothetical protein